MPHRRRAHLRHACYYQRILHHIDELYLRGQEHVREAIAHFEKEWGQIRVGQEWAATHVRSNYEALKLCSDYPGGAWSVLEFLVDPQERIQWTQVALHAAHRLERRSAEIAHLNALGSAYDTLRRHRLAIDCYSRALTIARDIGDRQWEGNTLRNMGLAYRDLGQPEQAAECHQQAVTISREVNYRRGEGADLCNLGNAYHALGQYERAALCCEQGLAVAVEIGDVRMQAKAHRSLGMIYADMKRYSDAMEFFHRALAVNREIGEKREAGSAFADIGTVCRRLARYGQAIHWYNQARSVFASIGALDLVDWVERHIANTQQLLLANGGDLSQSSTSDTMFPPIP